MNRYFHEVKVICSGCSRVLIIAKHRKWNIDTHVICHTCKPGFFTGKIEDFQVASRAGKKE